MDDVYVNMFETVAGRVCRAIENNTKLTLVGAGPKIVINTEGVFVSVGVQIEGVGRPTEFLGTGPNPAAAAENLVRSFGEWIRINQNHNG